MLTNVQHISRTNSSCLTETLCLLTSYPPFPLSLDLWQPLFDSMNLTILDTSYKVEFVLLWLAYFTWRNDLQVYPCYHICRIPFSFTAVQYSIVCIYHVFFNHSSIDRHLDCFHILAIVSSAVMNMGVLISLQNSGFSYFG